jgi:hypothetical protein
MRGHLLSCWWCGRPTPAGELVETHMRAGETTRQGWWLSADRVVWLCPACATPLRKPARRFPPERR